MKEKIGFLGGLISLVTVVVFAFYLLRHDIPQNLASWAMWAVLDTFVVISSVAAKNPWPWLPIGYCIGATVTTIILFNKGVWHWGMVESISSVGAIIAAICWIKLGPRSAIVALSVSMTIAGIPSLYDAWVLPPTESWWLWTICTITGVMSVYGAKAWTLEDRFFPCSSFLFNGVMAILVSRQWIMDMF